ncbi:MAG: trigger factor, partial [candidate division WOR-3 bacterium]
KLIGSVNPKALRELTINVTGEEIKSQLDNVARVYQKKARIQGFRPGKAPLDIVKTVFQKEIFEDAQDEAVRIKVLEEIKAKKEEVVSEIYIKEKREENDGLTVTVEYEAIPTFLFPNLSSIKVEKKIRRVSEIDVDDEIEKYQKKLGKLKPADRETKEGDFILVDYEEKENSKVVKKKQNLTLHVSSESINPAILDRFLNKRKGDIVELDFHDEEKDKDIKLIYRIKDVLELELPEANDEFAKKLGFESLEKMREEIRESIIKENEKVSEDELEWKIIEEIYSRTQFELPRTLVEEKITRIAQSFRYDPNNEEVRNSLRKLAEDLVKKEIILKNLIDQEGFELTDEELSKHIQEKAKTYRLDPEKYKKELERRGLLDNLKDEILRNKAMEFLKNSVRVEVIIE